MFVPSHGEQIACPAVRTRTTRTPSSTPTKSHSRFSSIPTPTPSQTFSVRADPPGPPAEGCCHPSSVVIFLLFIPILMADLLPTHRLLLFLAGPEFYIPAFEAHSLMCQQPYLVPARDSRSNCPSTPTASPIHSPLPHATAFSSYAASPTATNSTTPCAASHSPTSNSERRVQDAADGKKRKSVYCTVGRRRGPRGRCCIDDVECNCDGGNGDGGRAQRCRKSTATGRTQFKASLEPDRQVGWLRG